MAKWLTESYYRLYFGDNGISFYDDRGIVSHKQIRKDETEIEVAERMLDKYLHENAYRNWLKIVKIVYQVNKSIKRMMSDELYIEFLKSDDAKLIMSLKKKVLDSSLNDLWGNDNE